MAGNMNPFHALNEGVVLAGTTSAQQAALPGNGDCVAIENEGTGTAYVSFGKDTSSVSVTTTWQHAVPPGWRVVVWCGQATKAFSAKFSAGTGNINLTRGEGIG